MQSKKSVLCALCFMLSIGAADAAPLDFYAGIFGGVGGYTHFDNNSNETASASLKSYGAMFGIDVPVVRAEIEYNRLDAKEFDANTAMANIYLKFFENPIVVPYAGIGAGLMFGGNLHNEFWNIAIQNDWAAQAMLGASFKVPATGLHIDAEGRAMYLPSITDSDNLIDASAVSYELRAKVRYQF